MYHKHVMTLLDKIKNVSIYKLPRVDSVEADALAKLAKELANPNNEFMFVKMRNWHVLALLDLESQSDEWDRSASSGSSSSSRCTYHFYHRFHVGFDPYF